MNEEQESPKVVISGASETEAALVANRLNTEGIKTQIVGTGMTGRLPGLPTGYQVVVRRSDYERASRLVDALPPPHVTVPEKTAADWVILAVAVGMILILAAALIAGIFY